MKRLLALALLLPFLAACTPSQLSNAQVACTAATPVFTGAAASSNATAQSLATSGAALCSQVNSAVSTNVDSNTPTWVGTVVQDILQIGIPLAVAAL